MPAIPKTRVRRTVGLDAFATFFGPPGQHWEVTIDGHLLAEFDNHPDALAYAHRRAVEAQRLHVEKGTPEKRVQMHDTPPQEGSWIWLNRDAVDTPKVKLGDRVAFDAFGRKAIGTVTRCDEDGITIREERW